MLCIVFTYYRYIVHIIIIVSLFGNLTEIINKGIIIYYRIINKLIYVYIYLKKKVLENIQY